MMLVWLGAGLMVLATYALNKYLAWVRRLDLESGFASAQCVVEDPDSVDTVAAPCIFSEATRSLSVIYPAYNEEGRIESTLTETINYLQKRRDRQGPDFTYEVIVVDDGSRDATTRVALEYARRYGRDTVRVLRLVRNKGKGFAVKCGALYARGQQLLFADADGATPVAEVAKLQAAAERLLAGAGVGAGGAPGPQSGASLAQRNAAHAMQQQGCAFVLGSRAHLEQQAIAKRTLLRNFLMHGFHFAVMLVVGGTVRDTQCGFKLFTRPAARLLFGNQRLQRWCFDVELLFLAEAFNMPVQEVSVSWTEIPGSKVKLSGVALMAVELLTVRLMYSMMQLWHIRSLADVQS